MGPRGHDHPVSRRGDTDLAVLLDIAGAVRTSGWFPSVEDVAAKHGPDVLDGLCRRSDRRPLLSSAHGFCAWTGDALRLLRSDSFLGEELGRASALLDHMAGLMASQQRGPISIYELRRRLGWERPHDVRRAAYLLWRELCGAIVVTRAMEGSRAVPEVIKAGPGLRKAKRERLLNGPAGPGARAELRVVVRHATAEASLAETLVALVQAGLGLPAEAVRCVSLEGDALPGVGDGGSESLHVKLEECSVVLGILRR